MKKRCMYSKKEEEPCYFDRICTACVLHCKQLHFRRPERGGFPIFVARKSGQLSLSAFENLVLLCSLC